MLANNFYGSLSYPNVQLQIYYSIQKYYVNTGLKDGRSQYWKYLIHQM